MRKLSELKIVQKIYDKWIDLDFEVDFLRSKDVSTRFKLLNLISGDRLRLQVAIANARVHDIQNKYLDLKKEEEVFGDEMTTEDYKMFYERLKWYIDKSIAEMGDIWKI